MFHADLLANKRCLWLSQTFHIVGMDNNNADNKRSMDETTTQTRKCSVKPALIGLTVTAIVVIVLTGVKVGLRGRSTVGKDTDMPVGTTKHGGKRPLFPVKSN